VLDDEPLGPVDVAEVLGEVGQHHLVGEARAAEVRGEQRPATGGELGLLGEFALRGLQRRLAVGVPEAGGQLPEVAADRVAVLAQQHDAVVVVQGYDRHRARVPYHVAHAVAAARHRHRVAVQGEDVPLEHRLAVEDAVLVGLAHQMPTFSPSSAPSSTGTGSRAASW
jgi:hypothetical protein